MSNPGDSDELRMMESPPLPVTSARARTMEVVATENLHYQGFRLKKAGPTFGDRMRSVNWGPIVLALVIGLAGGAGLWSWRTTSAKRKTVAVVESPLDYHKRQFLAELRGAGSNAGSMQVRWPVAERSRRLRAQVEPAVRELLARETTPARAAERLRADPTLAPQAREASIQALLRLTSGRPQ